MATILADLASDDTVRDGYVLSHYLRLTSCRCGLCFFVADLGSYIILPPLLRHFELMVCREYYVKHNPSLIEDNGNVPERLCKKDAIASDFALLRGWLSVLEGIAGKAPRHLSCGPEQC